MEYVSKILLCGDKEEFYAAVGNRACKIVGQVEFTDKGHKADKYKLLKEGKFVLDGKTHEVKELAEIFKRGEADHLIYTRLDEYLATTRGVLLGAGCTRMQVMTAEQFSEIPASDFLDYDGDFQLITLLRLRGCRRVLDFGGHFMRSQLWGKGGADSLEIDCIYDGEVPPIRENFYSRVYKKFSDCCFRHYDAAIVFADEPLEFDSAYFMLENVTDFVITFSRFNGALKNHLRATLSNFAKVDGMVSFNGEWLLCYRRPKPKDFAMYVVTHKLLPAEHVAKLPAGYKLIHAGRELSTDLGYIGDNSGDNISYLNAYINEVTALYWMWKNTSHTVIGLSHYRRYFTDAGDMKFEYGKILTEEKALALLKDNDILVISGGNYSRLVDGITYNVQNEKMVKFAVSVLRKYLAQVQPEYVDAFDTVCRSSYFYNKNMFVTRRHIFNAYCTWFFSFFLDATREVVATTNLSVLQGWPKRLMGFFAEHMLTVWLLKNRLRIKELNFMTITDI